MSRFSSLSIGKFDGVLETGNRARYIYGCALRANRALVELWGQFWLVGPQKAMIDCKSQFMLSICRD